MTPQILARVSQNQNQKTVMTATAQVPPQMTPQLLPRVPLRAPNQLAKPHRVAAAVAAVPPPHLTLKALVPPRMTQPTPSTAPPSRVTVVTVVIAVTLLPIRPAPILHLSP